ncbi:MAG TPA: antitoxin [Chloroflexota bacterium]|nr:antitoxin [Chloroflexota bacterium]
MLERRLQVLLDERRYQKIMREAKRRGVSAGAILRAAIDELPDDTDRRRAALEAILTAEPMPVPTNPADLRAELDEIHDRLSM